MKTGEIIRVIVISLVGALLMFLVQPFIYKQGWMGKDPDLADPLAALESWANGSYMVAAGVVFGVSVICTIFWCAMAAKSKAHRPDELRGWSLAWWILGLFPVLSIGPAIGFFNPIAGLRLSLALFFVLDILILFWLPTASSTPGLLIYTPPFAHPLRDLIDRFF
ncbi:hypothetical protein V0288_04810 [Pannus brasiliensis CCIBt3594]|uniref:Uncharacterized protein n=1 Tax=Pannus brasiliensis CCIBt3594 TaxID=1427578 RepID=A0AAW9QQZ3_9CHRO